MKPFDDVRVKNVFESYGAEIRMPMMRIRQLIFEVADTTSGVGELEETLKWGEPSYVTAQSGSGSTVRVDRFNDTTVALYFHCKTMLVEDFRGLFGDELRYSKNRAILFDIDKPLPEDLIRQCVEMALRYHLNRRKIA